MQRPLAVLLSLALAIPAAADPCLRAPSDSLDAFLGDLGPAFECGPIRPEEIPPAAWTFYVHMAADNDLAPFGRADIEEMARAGSAPGRTNVFVLADGPASWGPAKLLWIPPAGSGCGAREVIVDGPLARHLAEPNMGDPAVLRDALTFVTSRVPSRRVFLDLWNHGAGWRGIGFDDSGDHLDFASGELARAIDGLPVDVIGADACYTATLEVALVADELVSTNVSALVASQETEPGHGWDYDDLLPRLANVIDPDRDVPIFDVVSEVVRSYEGTGAETMSATDVRMSGYVTDNVGKLAMAVLEAGGLADNATLRRLYEESLRFGQEGELMDLGNFARRIAEAFDGELRARALALSSSLAGATVHGTGRGGRYTEARGLSIYAPRGRADASYARAVWSDFWLTEWNRVIDSYAAGRRPDFEVPAWARPHGRPPARLPHSATSWSERRRLPVALSWSHAHNFDGDLYVTFGGHSATGGARVASASLDRASKTVRVRLEPDGDASGFDGHHAEEMFSGSVRYAPPGDGVWTVVFEYDGNEIGRTEWQPPP